MPVCFMGFLVPIQDCSLREDKTHKLEIIFAVNKSKPKGSDCYFNVICLAQPLVENGTNGGNSHTAKHRLYF
jgi:hypothetical protein